MYLKTGLVLTALSLSSSLAGPDPDLPFSPIQDPEDPDFSGIVDFSNATPGPDGSWCITKVKYVDHMENDQVKECWHQNITQCHDTYITEFLPSQEQKCEETFWKSCKIDFKEVPFNYSLKQCHTPLVKQCDDYSDNYGSPGKTVCRTWFESECNTTYIESPSGDHKPNTWCQKMPKKICAPDNCNMVQGPEDCRDKTMVSTIQKPMEHCELQPQRHCSLITKLVPHLTTREVCKVIPKEICVLKLVNPHPVKKPITLKWCTKKKPDLPTYQPAKPAGGSYLPPQSPPQYSPPPSYSPPGHHRREGGSGTAEDPFIISVDGGEKFAELNQLPADFNQIISAPIRQVRNPEGDPSHPSHASHPGHHNPNLFHHARPGPVRKRHVGPHGARKQPHSELLSTAGSDLSVHVVTPEPLEREDVTTQKSVHVVKAATVEPVRASQSTTMSASASKTAPSSRMPRSQPPVRGSSLRNYPGSIF